MKYSAGGIWLVLFPPVVTDFLGIFPDMPTTVHHDSRKNASAN
jgi:hypothetical protein